VFTLAVLMFFQGSLQAPTTSGSLVGCALDKMQQRIPGVTVVAKAGRVRRTTTTDASGCYELGDLPAGSYRVTARLPGFVNATSDGVSILANVAHLDIAMRLSPLCECVNLAGTTLAEQWDHADAVLHVRLAAPESQSTTPEGYYRHVASVIDALKVSTDSLKTPVSVLQNQWSGAADPYDIGQEAVVFLRSSGSNGFKITNDELGPAIVFLIQNARIQAAPLALSRYVGMPLDMFLAELRALPRGKPRGQ
jgi:hypothetical protein